MKMIDKDRFKIIEINILRISDNDTNILIMLKYKQKAFELYLDYFVNTEMRKEYRMIEGIINIQKQEIKRNTSKKYRETETKI